MTEPGNHNDGTGTFFARHRFAVIATALAVAFLLLGTGAVFAGISSASLPTANATPTATTTTAPPRAVPTALPASAGVRTCSIAALANDPTLMTLYGSVEIAKTGSLLYTKRGDEPRRPASVLKVLTAAAAVTVLGNDAVLTTRVMDSPVPGTIVLVGGGDATLSRLPAGQQSYYPNAPKLSDLAAQATAAYIAAHPGVPITSVVLDSSYWDSADAWDPTWDRSEQTTGYQSEVTALQVDGDRDDPTKATSPRSDDPVQRAGAEFVKALGFPNITLSEGTAENGAPVLAQVQSQPVKVLVKQMLLSSDNTLAEMLARVVSKESAMDGSASSLQTAIPKALAKFGMDFGAVTIRDGSGLSNDNLVATRFMADFMARVATDSSLSTVKAGLSVAGKTGSLASRFTGDSSVAVGAVLAKTGWLTTAYTLSGIVNAKDGTQLTFAFYALGDGISDKAQAALDALAAGVYTCGNNLSNVQ
ncbi:D-alanyl-D-alanine carboxypeptidase/D-alanyl-D-alanine-endopeptidase [Glaciihabitans sp. dw_435]|uniref:D-alanyl-D-alanine carboxypeptidase/D-alanyl-D-alanine endopeptidase n=1 Tax=Glaciihabitans sp. dw_435 TaxID=2720081 RepID=UPI0027DCD840|nr:D-alanyl-D-alanine carboxypeptidase/D-alanyl-D-alanine-endopeptidase [Glaciihabitans sp. dw_435]